MNKKHKESLFVRVKNAVLSPLGKKILFTIAMLGIFRLGANITLPTTKTSIFLNLNALDFFTMMTGGNLNNMTLFAMGISPFITSAIIVELMANDVIPYLSRLKKENQNEKKNKITNMLGIIIAIPQSLGITYLLDKQYGILRGGDIYSYIFTAAMLTVGSAILLWVSKQIDAHGIGNGSSLIIASGILFRLPHTIAQAFDSIVSYKDASTIGQFALLIIVFVAIIMFVVYIEKSERRIKIQFPNAGMSYEQSIKEGQFLPVKVNPAGVVPVIFASSIMQCPIIICSLMNKSFGWLDWFKMSEWYSIILYGILVIAFTFFYSKTIINPHKINEDFKKTGCSVVGVRPGIETEQYLKQRINRVCFYGACSLLVIAITPLVLPKVWDVAGQGLSVGGTSLIIVTGVALQLADKIKGEASKKQYKEASLTRKRGF